MLGAVLAPVIEPMLAGHGVPAGSIANWAAEPKLDGWRARVTVDGGTVTVSSRGGKRLRVPALDLLAEGGTSMVLDGELVARAGRLENFYEVAPRLSSRQPAHISLVAFDVVWLDGELLTGLPYEDRRQQLVSLPVDASAVTVVPSWPGEDAADLLAACEEQGVEGIVLKRLGSKYRPGARSYDWRKVKCQAWRDHLELRRPRR